MAEGRIRNWFIRFTPYSTAHVVHQQEQVNSCGIACILMINLKMKKGLMAAGMAASAAVSVVPVLGGFLGVNLGSKVLDYAVKTEPQVYKIYGDVVGTVYDGTAYTNGLKHPDVLRQLGCGEWECVDAGAAGISAAIKAAVEKGAPCIVHVVWKAGGAHFVVVDEVVNMGGLDWAMVNDPADGDVHVTLLPPGSAPSYDAGAGSFSGWIVRRK